MYVGAISGVIGAFIYERSVPNAAAMNPALAILVGVICTSIMQSSSVTVAIVLMLVTLAVIKMLHSKGKN